MPVKAGTKVEREEDVKRKLTNDTLYATGSNPVTVGNG